MNLHLRAASSYSPSPLPGLVCVCTLFDNVEQEEMVDGPISRGDSIEGENLEYQIAVASARVRKLNIQVHAEFEEGLAVW